MTIEITHNIKTGMISKENDQTIEDTETILDNSKVEAIRKYKRIINDIVERKVPTYKQINISLGLESQEKEEELKTLIMNAKEILQTIQSEIDAATSKAEIRAKNFSYLLNQL